MKNVQQNIDLSGQGQMPADEFSNLVINNLIDYSILTTNRDLIINCWYASATELFGYEPQEVIGKPIDIIFTLEDIKDRIPLMEKEMALKEGRAPDNRWHVRKDSSLFYAYGQLYPLMNDTGEVIGFIKILRDLTHRKMNEDKIHKHMKELENLIIHKDNILHILSHDLRSPLGTIIGITDYLKSDASDMLPDNIKQMLDILYQASRDELNMLDYLLEWARIKHASDAFTPFLLNLKPIIIRIFETFNEVAASKSIMLLNEVKDDTLVYADKKMLISILQNLITNAINHTNPGGTITISATAEADRVVVSVTDTGVGMSPEKVDKLFRAQLKTLAQARKENKGAGIGLLLVKGFVERNGGKIQVKSTEGKGSTFYFTLPVSESTEKQISSENLQFDTEA